MACGDEKARFAAVILDPMLPRTAPRGVSAVAGYDALSHAVESLVSRDANPLSRVFSREAWRLLERSYEAAIGGDASDAVWSDLLLGAHLAGAAIEASMLGAAHACANPLTARFGVAHGVAVGIMLPAVVRMNAPVAGALYDELVGAADGAGAETLARRLEVLRRAGGLPARLSTVGVSSNAIPRLASEARQQWTLEHNPLVAGEADLVDLYRSVL
jgi:alcohol dehydrogenase